MSFPMLVLCGKHRASPLLHSYITFIHSLSRRQTYRYERELRSPCNRWVCANAAVRSLSLSCCHTPKACDSLLPTFLQKTFNRSKEEVTSLALKSLDATILLYVFVWLLSLESLYSLEMSVSLAASAVNDVMAVSAIAFGEGEVVALARKNVLQNFHLQDGFMIIFTVLLHNFARRNYSTF